CARRGYRGSYSHMNYFDYW
nr:immunoglobulin heavy chain junction region [Macaca mulatta]MOX93149.1 immunoglobulin heavy chain junction region [Macaca mulatta]MOX93391.1 immunoglobulin heavy chain junction region [Macaca mulatta]MOX93803.1 immunoglobulin heavy chain junction region [Macaca mulatta]MOX94535.1 immunoglobulin heavy chain junction region [Macaca mulatta]